MHDQHESLHRVAVAIEQMVDHRPAVDRRQNFRRGALKTGAGACGRDDQDRVRSAHARGPLVPLRAARGFKSPAPRGADRLPRPRDALPRDDRQRPQAFNQRRAAHALGRERQKLHRRFEQVGLLREGARTTDIDWRAYRRAPPAGSSGSPRGRRAHPTACRRYSARTAADTPRSAHGCRAS